MIKLCLVAAVTNSGAIGANGDLLWHYRDLPSDMDHFRDVTRGKVVLMGRKTWDGLSIHPLPRRTCIVVTSRPEDINDWEDPAARAFTTLGEAMLVAEELAAEQNQDSYYAIGGGIIYRTLIDVADEMWITHVDVDLEGDTYFPPIDPNEWDITVKPEEPRNEFRPIVQSGDKYPISIKHYKRLGKNANQRNQT